MEITQIDGEGTLLEEALETPSAGTDVDIDAIEQGGIDNGENLEYLVDGDLGDLDDISSSGGGFNTDNSFDFSLDGFYLGGWSDGDNILGLPDDSVTESDLIEGTEEQEETVDSALPEASSSPTLLLSDEPLAVYLVEQPEETIDVQSLDGSPYPGTISSTYLDYFSGIVDKLGYNEHYVAYRSGQYEYILAWGEGLEYDLTRFKGSALSYCRIYRANNNYSDYYVEFGNDTVYLTPGTGFVYSDLGDFATLTEGGTHLEMLTLLFAVGFAVVYSVCHDLFDYVMEHVYRK